MFSALLTQLHIVMFGEAAPRKHIALTLMGVSALLKDGTVSIYRMSFTFTPTYILIPECVLVLNLKIIPSLIRYRSLKK